MIPILAGQSLHQSTNVISLVQQMRKNIGEEKRAVSVVK
jgi:hypothetical protein